jgi:hypothetical protein
LVPEELEVEVDFLNLEVQEEVEEELFISPPHQ